QHLLVVAGPRSRPEAGAETRRPPHDPPRDSRDGIAERAREPETVQRAHRRDIRAADRRATGPAVGLEDVAVEPQGALAERLEIDHGTNGAADQPLDLDCSPLLLPTNRLSLASI